MILRLKDIGMYFSGLKALDGTDLNIQKGTIHGLIGPNGAGKTTLFNIISGFYKPTFGHVFFEEREITGKKAFEIARMGIGRTFQATILFTDRTVLENILIGIYCNKRGLFKYPFMTPGVFKSWNARDIKEAEDILRLMGLLEYKNYYVNQLPLGLRHFLEIGRALAINPKLLLLDEPTTGLNPVEQAKIIEMIRSICRKGITILIVEHNMKVIMNICERISVLGMGKQIAEGTPEEVSSNPNVIESYLGKEEHYA